MGTTRYSSADHARLFSKTWPSRPFREPLHSLVRRFLFRALETPAPPAPAPAAPWSVLAMSSSTTDSRPRRQTYPFSLPNTWCGHVFPHLGCQPAVLLHLCITRRFRRCTDSQSPLTTHTISLSLSRWPFPRPPASQLDGHLLPWTPASARFLSPGQVYDVSLELVRPSLPSLSTQQRWGAFIHPSSAVHNDVPPIFLVSAGRLNPSQTVSTRPGAP